MCDVASQVQMALGGSNEWVTVYNGPRAQTSVSPIRSDEDLQFRLRERNCAGTSPFSKITHARTLSELDQPGPPQLDVATSHSICVLAVLPSKAAGSFESQSSDGSFAASVSYRAVSRDGSIAPAWTEIDNATSLSNTSVRACVGALMSGSHYQFRLLVPKMERPISLPALYSTLREVPNQPSRAVLQEAAPTSLAVSWSSILEESSTNASPVSAYFVEVAELSGAAFAKLQGVSGNTNVTNSTVATNGTTTANATQNASGSGSVPSDSALGITFFRMVQTKKTKALLGGLQPGSSYAVRIVASNDVGSSTPSPILYTFTKPAAPTVPQGFHFVAAASDSVRVEWTAAQPNGAPIANYEVEMRGGVAVDWTNVYTGLSTHKTIEALEPNIWYMFRVRAVNAIAPGTFSPSLTIQTPLPGTALSLDQLASANVPVASLAQMRRQPVESFSNLIQTEETAPVSAVSNALIPNLDDLDDVSSNDISSATVSPADHKDTTVLVDQSNPTHTNAAPVLDTVNDQPGISSNGGISNKPAVVPVSIDGKCPVGRGDCVEKDPTTHDVYFSCPPSATSSDTTPALLPSCAFPLSSLVFEGSAASMPATRAYELTQQGCGCACSGDNPACGAVGALLFFSGTNSSQDCAQVMCLESKFSTCYWKGKRVASGMWNAESLTFTSSVLATTCTNISNIPINCPNSCGGFSRGVCLGRGTCRCLRGWSGIDCTTPVCPERMEGCAGHGKCMQPNQCVCDQGFGGQDCDKFVTPLFSSKLTNRSVGEYTGGKEAAIALASERKGVLVLEEPMTVHHPLAPTHIAKKRAHAVEQEPVSAAGTWVAFPKLDAFDFTGNLSSFTLAAWIRVANDTAANDAASIVSYGDFKKGPGYGMGLLRGGHVYCGVGTTALPLRASSIAMAVSLESFTETDNPRFRHIACVFDAQRNRLSLIVDGVGAPLRESFPFTGGKILVAPQGTVDIASLKSIAPFAPADIQAPFVIGASWDMQSEYFDGEISEVILRSGVETVQMLEKWRWQHITSADINTRFVVSLSDCALGLPYIEALTMHGEPQIVHLLLSANTNKHVPLCRAVHHPLAAPEANAITTQE
eukprot:c11882_g1_i1.p1 GENE.c11882_g1_i1~~c11882_g1_i1.p1  ORF type:complete len:1189 (-),score=347.49 c11882_g1_i1:713-3994(-)